jgi:hypothetical protein
MHPIRARGLSFRDGGDEACASLLRPQAGMSQGSRSSTSEPRADAPARTQRSLRCPIMLRAMATSKRAAGATRSPAPRNATPAATRAKKPSIPAPKTLCAVSIVDAGARFFAPARPKLGAARDAIASIIDPAEAWEALAARSVIPLSWHAHPTRQIVADGGKCTRCDDPFIGHSKGCPIASTPATVRAALALAADPDAVEAVEALALEAFARIRPNAEKPWRIVWRVVGSDAPTVLYTKRPGAHLAPSIHQS